MFCTYQYLHGAAGQDSLRRYLCEEFGFTYEANFETIKGIDKDEIEELKKKIVEIRRGGGRQKDREETLSYNDALHVLRVYEKRRELGEASKPNPFGYRTWWLTQETMCAMQHQKRFASTALST
jgi:hypothetical protein